MVQRLVENPVLELLTAFDIASSLDRAQKNAEIYSHDNNFSTMTAAAVSNGSNPEQQNLVPQSQSQQLQHEQNIAAVNNWKCFFCGNAKHHRCVLCCMGYYLPQVF